MVEHWGLAKWGYREAAVSVVIAAAAAVIVGYLAPVYFIAVPVIIGLWAISFFRDPARAVPEGEGVVVSPADGKVVEITEVDEPDYIGGPALKIGIFLSIFNVHINRSPCGGDVEMTAYRPGKFLNALKADSSKYNESNAIGISGNGCRMLVKQIAGAIARRIECDCHEGDSLARGEKFGMIKFGSRTELYVPVDAGFALQVKVGDKVRAGSSVLGAIR